MQEIRVGIIGTGMMGNTHAEAIRRIPGTKIVAICGSRSYEKNRKLADELGIPNAYADYKEMLDKERLDVVHNCTPNNMHYEINLEILKRGINVYCEKPLAMTSEETAELTRIAAEKGVKAGVNFNYRHNATVRDMNERLKMPVSEGGAGDVYLVHGTYIQDWLMYDTDFNWRCVSEIGGVSRAVADIGSHWFDTVQYITGHKITSVYAKFITIFPQRKKPEKEVATFTTAKDVSYKSIDIDTEDAAYIMVKFDNGVMGNVVVSQVSGGRKNGFQIDVDAAQYSMRWFQEDCDKLLIGTRSCNSIYHAGAEMLHGDAVRYATLPSGHPLGWADALRSAVREYYNDVRGVSACNYATFADGDYIERIVEACVKSSREDKWIDVM